MSKYLPDHLWVFNTSNDPDVTPVFTAGFYIDIEHPYMDSSSFASTLFDDQRYDCSRIFGLSGWHALMPGHDGYSRADSQLLHRALSTRVFTGFAVADRPGACAVAIHQTCANADATAGSVGFAARHCQIRIVDTDGHDVMAAENGQILIKGPNVFKEYWYNSMATENALRKGWFHSGDIGYCRPDGAYVISDRKADLIISGGENIYPAELEAILDEHPEIAEAAVVGEPDERWGEVPVAVVVMKKDGHMDEEGVRALFKNRLARFKHPQRVMLVDELPRNAMGKVEKFELRKQIASTPSR